MVHTRDYLLNGCQDYLNAVATLAGISKHSVCFVFRLRAIFPSHSAVVFVTYSDHTSFTLSTVRGYFPRLVPDSASAECVEMN